jgi:hypothetical protein
MKKREKENGWHESSNYVPCNVLSKKEEAIVSMLFGSTDLTTFFSFIRKRSFSVLSWWRNQTRNTRLHKTATRRKKKRGRMRRQAGGITPHSTTVLEKVIDCEFCLR